MSTLKITDLQNDDYCPNCGNGDPDGCPLCGRTLTQECDITYITTDDMLPGEFDSIVSVKKDRA